MILIIFQGSLCYVFYPTKFVWHMVDDGESLKSCKPKKDRNKEKRTSKIRLLTVEDAISHPEKDCSNEKKISKGYAGTVQDADWHPKKEPEDYSRKQVYGGCRVSGEYEN